MALFRRRPDAGVMHHSDRGSQYASHAFQDKLKEVGMTCSMSRKANCWDTHAEMKAISFEHIEIFYNRTRQNLTLGYQSPMQYLDGWRNEQNQGKHAA